MTAELDVGRSARGDSRSPLMEPPASAWAHANVTPRNPRHCDVEQAARHPPLLGSEEQKECRHAGIRRVGVNVEVDCCKHP